MDFFTQLIEQQARAQREAIEEELRTWLIAKVHAAMIAEDPRGCRDFEQMATVAVDCFTEVLRSPPTIETDHNGIETVRYG